MHIASYEEYDSSAPSDDPAQFDHWVQNGLPVSGIEGRFGDNYVKDIVLKWQLFFQIGLANQLRSFRALNANMISLFFVSIGTTPIVFHFYLATYIGLFVSCYQFRSIYNFLLLFLTVLIILESFLLVWGDIQSLPKKQ